MVIKRSQYEPCNFGHNESEMTKSQNVRKPWIPSKSSNSIQLLFRSYNLATKWMKNDEKSKFEETLRFLSKYF